MAEKPYKYIRAWGILNCEKESWIEYQITLARKMNAPNGAVYWSGGKWWTFNDIPSEATRAKVSDIVAELK